jgi:hypothetical protein
MHNALLILFRFLEALFFVGMVGSAVVLCITTVEDLRVLFEKDEPAPGTGAAPETTQISAEPVPSAR